MPSTAADSFSHKKTKQTNDCLMPVSDAHRCKVSQQEISEKKKTTHDAALVLLIRHQSVSDFEGEAWCFSSRLLRPRVYAMKCTL